MSEEELWLHLETEMGKNQLLAKINKAVETLEEQERHIKEANAEIERLKEDNKYLNKVNIELSTEKNILNNIIKEVREKLLCYGETFDLKLHQQMQKELLEILDKEKV